MSGPTTSEYRRLRLLLWVMAAAMALTLGVIWIDGEAAERRDERQEERQLRLEARQDYRACLQTREARTAIKGAFENLFDGFIREGRDREAAIAFKEQQMGPLREALPEPVCVEP